MDFNTSVYLQSAEVGENRGTHSIVALKAWDDTTGSWQELYSGLADAAQSAYFDITGQYHIFSPAVCQTSFKTSRLRIEMVRASAPVTCLRVKARFLAGHVYCGGLERA